MTDTNTNELETITPRQLRQILFGLDGRKTVSEIRNELYEMEQDREYQIGPGMQMQMEVDANLQILNGLALRGELFTA